MIEPDQVVMIGDTMETDIRGAFEAGIRLSGVERFDAV